MPLPSPGTPWPPPALADLLPTFNRWSAWYTGDPDQLLDAYGSTSIRQHLNRPAQMAGGIVGAAARMIWGRPVPEDQADDRWHVPLASDLCAATAELAYSDPPQITTTNPDAGVRVTEYIDDGLFTTAAGGVESGAALGGHYLTAVLPEGATRARLRSMDYDGAYPRFAYGVLQDVAFWWQLPTVSSGDRGIFRHFESHELDAAGVGVIRHRLYLGTTDKIGQVVDLSQHPATSPLVNPDRGLTLDGSDAIWSTGSPGLDVVHIPSRTPQRLWRRHPLGCYMGRSILQGIEGALGKLDDTYTSWMRDIELGRARLVIADYLLESAGPGQGARFDMDRKLLTPVSMPPPIGVGPVADPITMVQFAIRMEDHRATCQELTEVILRAASYSAQTFGEDENGNAQTATGVLSKDSRSMRTRRVMLTPERVGLQYIVRKMLAMDQAAGLGLVDDPELSVVFPEGAEETPLVMAQTAVALRTAEAASDNTIVRYVHPDWDDERVELEVQAIIAQRNGPAPVLADPTTIGTTGGF